MKAQQTNNVIESVERFIAKYDQQDATARNCGFGSYIEMLVLFDCSTVIWYSLLTKYAAMGWTLSGYTANN